MSSQSIGIMSVTLPKDKVVDFEDWFSEDNPHAFNNIHITMRENHIDSERENIRKREYDVECYSLLDALIENRDDDISVICRDLGVEEIEIETSNLREMFRENITYKDGVYRYSGTDDDIGVTDEFTLPREKEVVAE